jgi:hypothetical protein
MVMPSQAQAEQREGKKMRLVPENLTFSEVGHLPIVKDFAKKIRLVETIDAMVDSQMELSPGITILAMVLDTLSGRTPLYRLEEFFQDSASLMRPPPRKSDPLLHTGDLKAPLSSMVIHTAPSSFIPPPMTSDGISVSIGCLIKSAKSLKHM